MTNGPVSDEWVQWRSAVDLDAYEARWDEMSERGENPHGEVDFVMQFAPTTALDAGCGFGRVGIELAARGVEIVGVDLDPDLLGRARRRAPALEWHIADLSEFDTSRRFDLVVAAGNVIGYVDAPKRERAVRNCARLVAPGGHLVMGNQVHERWPTLGDYDRWCDAVGLEPAGHRAGWDGAPLGDAPDYAVTVHRRPLL